MTTTPGPTISVPEGNPAERHGGQPMVCVITTESDAARAEQLARALVERRLAACVSLLPLSSIYIWEGRLEQSDEVQLLIKTTPSCVEALQRAVLELHSYDTPMWVQWQAQASDRYGAWLAQVTAPPSAPPRADAD